MLGPLGLCRLRAAHLSAPAQLARAVAQPAPGRHHTVLEPSALPVHLLRALLLRRHRQDERGLALQRAAAQDLVRHGPIAHEEPALQRGRGLVVPVVPRVGRLPLRPRHRADALPASSEDPLFPGGDQLQLHEQAHVQHRHLSLRDARLALALRRARLLCAAAETPVRARGRVWPSGWRRRVRAAALAPVAAAGRLCAAARHAAAGPRRGRGCRAGAKGSASSLSAETDGARRLRLLLLHFPRSLAAAPFRALPARRLVARGGTPARVAYEAAHQARLGQPDGRGGQRRQVSLPANCRPVRRIRPTR
mmetsp:Transcript_22576/g.47512  ORF Transcript_22576/g.47512 Transcript_22576/m.47512 type:complete len:307 (+) Transcript_22576:578-1498(+)